MIRMKGAVTFVSRVGKDVEVWLNAPTGDSSDSNIFHIPCTSEGQAKVVADLWRKVWGL